MYKIQTLSDKKNNIWKCWLLEKPIRKKVSFLKVINICK